MRACHLQVSNSQKLQVRSINSSSCVKDALWTIHENSKHLTSMVSLMLPFKWPGVCNHNNDIIIINFYIKKNLGVIDARVANPPPPCPVAMLCLYGFGFLSFTFQRCGHWHNELLKWVKEILSKFGWWHWRHRLACVPCHYKGQHKGWETCCGTGYFNCRFIFYFLFFGGMYNLEFVHTEKSISWWPTFKDILTLSSLFEKRKPITWHNQE